MAFRTNKMPVLQTKSASGAVATFNTALAMPLSSCNIAVNAWQEGTGDPSPVNKRTIHGFSVVNATRQGKNWCPYDNLTGTRRIEKAISLPVGSYVFSALCTSTDTDSTVCSFIFQYKDGTFSSLRQIQRNVRSSNTINIVKPATTLYVYASSDFTSSADDDFTFSDIQIELGSTATAYEPYVTPTIYPIQLGQEVYGAEVDVDNGVAHCTHKKELFNGTEEWRNNYSNGVYLVNSWNYKSVAMADKLKALPNVSGGGSLTDYSISINNAYTNILAKNIDNLSVSDFKTWLSNNNMTVIFELATPFDIQLTPQQIETLIGNNTIFADTGDIDLTFKDLDIAKRGNFREVFKLPS